MQFLALSTTPGSTNLWKVVLYLSFVVTVFKICLPNTRDSSCLNSHVIQHCARSKIIFISSQNWCGQWSETCNFIAVPYLDLTLSMWSRDSGILKNGYNDSDLHVCITLKLFSLYIIYCSDHFCIAHTFILYKTNTLANEHSTLTCTCRRKAEKAFSQTTQTADLKTNRHTFVSPGEALLSGRRILVLQCPVTDIHVYMCISEITDTHKIQVLLYIVDASNKTMHFFNIY